MNGKKCKQLRKIYYRAYDPNVKHADIRMHEKAGREMIHVRYNKPVGDVDRRIISLTYVNSKNSARANYQKAKTIVYGHQLP